MEYRHAILQLYEEEHVSEREIARRLGLSTSTVHYWIIRRGESAQTKQGRPRITNKDEDQALFRASCSNPFLTAVDLRGNLKCSIDTIRNRLKEKGLKCRIPARKPFLTQYHKQMRYVFAQSHLNWTLQDWSRVVFSDEKVFRSSSRGALRVYRPLKNSDRYDDAYLVPSTNPSTGSSPRFTICVWMCFSGTGLRRLHRIERKTLNSEYYTTQILASIEQDLCDNDLTFMQDLSSIHTSRATKHWLSERNINVMSDWPPKGPDMNPVENVWAELVRRVEKNRQGIVNRDQLWEDIWRAFQEIPDSYFENLIRSMPNRVGTVASKHGGWTKY